MTRNSVSFVPAIFVIAGAAAAQPPGVTFEDIARELPLEGAPVAVPGPYEVLSEPAFGLPSHVVHRPAELDAFPSSDTLPVMAWGNGGCAIDSTRYGEFLSTIASHGFLVISTVAVEGEEQARGAPENMIAAFDWAERENARAGSPLAGKVAIDRMAAMGQSCGGFMSVSAGADPRVGTIGMFNSAVQAPSPNAPGGRASTDDLADLHGPVLLINGGDVDFMYEPAQANYEIIDHVPVFYGARDNAGHTATVFHPGGGEFANVASSWLRYVFKDDAEAGEMFVGSHCSLCTDSSWETMSKGLD